jgi:hypothetical protein
MSETKFTPGPWRVEEGTTLVWGATSDETSYMKWPVARAELAQQWQKQGRPTEDEAEANARLIAAAPTLYEALEEAVACIIANRATPGVFYEDSFEGSTLAKCEAVLAKARGER